MWQLHFSYNKGKQEQAMDPFHTPEVSINLLALFGSMVFKISSQMKHFQVVNLWAKKVLYFVDVAPDGD